MSSHKGITLLENTPVATRYAKVSETMNGASSTTLTFQGSEQLFLDRGVFVEVDVPVVLTRKTALTMTNQKRQTTFHGQITLRILRFASTGSSLVLTRSTSSSTRTRLPTSATSFVALK
jgi:hypothetical protein